MELSRSQLELGRVPDASENVLAVLGGIDQLRENVAPLVLKSFESPASTSLAFQLGRVKRGAAVDSFVHGHD